MYQSLINFDLILQVLAFSLAAVVVIGALELSKNIEKIGDEEK